MSINKYRVDSVLNKYLQLQIEWKKKIDWNNSTVALFHRLYKDSRGVSQISGTSGGFEHSGLFVGPNRKFAIGCNCLIF